MEHTATYSPDDNKLRLYPAYRLDAEEYARMKAKGFKWAPKQELFFAPMWTPSREDLLLTMAGEIGDEDTNLVDRAEDRAERFETYSEHRQRDAESAHKAVAAIADGIPLGQPILVGHHSERHARRDQKRIEDGMRKTVKMWETAKYWESRAAGAIAHAKYKELPAVRARRIKTIEADKRKRERDKAHAEKLLRVWSRDDLTEEQALAVLNVADHGGVMLDGERHWSGWSALKDGKTTVAEIRTQRLANLPGQIAYYDRWLAHYDNRLAYERAMLGEVGGIVADRTKPEKGGACRCWASPRGGWSWIQKVNRVSVTVLRNFGNGGRNFPETIPFDKLAAVMTAAEVQAARDEGRLIEMDGGTGFGLCRPSPETPAAAPAEPPAPTEAPAIDAADIDAMRASLKAGVQVIAAPQLFPTSVELAARMVELAEIEEGDRTLEPSAGTGRLLDPLFNAEGTEWKLGKRGELIAVEINTDLARRLRATYAAATVLHGNFLELTEALGSFDRILMNPPFANGADIKHIQAAAGMLRPGGRLVALCANGPRQRAALQPIASSWEDLPAGSFAAEGTGVNVALLTIDAPAVPAPAIERAEPAPAKGQLALL